MFIGARLSAFVETGGLGRVYAAETGYLLRRTPDTVRAPDVSFVSRDRPAGVRAPRGFIAGAPDLAVEVRSPDDSLAKLRAKATEYLEAGARLVWIIDRRTRKAYVYRPGQAPATMSMHDVFDGEDVLPGFEIPVARLFAELD
jgi:Uma2 family endonuclease